MELFDLIGLPIETVKHKLEANSIEYIVTENSDIQKNHDTVLVVNIKKISQNKVEITTDKFLLNV